MKPQPTTIKFSAKRQEIIDIASKSINLHGVAGFSSTEVAEAVGLTHNSLKYYFKRKNDLVHACFAQTFERLDAMIGQAAFLDSPEERVTRFLDISFTRIADITLGTAGRFLRIADLRAIDEPERSELLGRFASAIFKIVALFGTETDTTHNQIRAYLLWEITRSVAVWLPLHDPREYQRIKRHFIAMLVDGIAPGANNHSIVLKFEPVSAARGNENYLKAAIRVINDVGYRGASVNRIAAELNVTKGGFYHHLDNKLDLVVECSDRTVSLLENIIDAAQELEGTQLDRLIAIACTIFELQLTGTEPLLRIPTLYASSSWLPKDILERLNKTALRIAGIFVEGMIEGSVPILDPNIASHVMLSLLNASHEISAHLPELDRPILGLDCIHLIFNGLIRD